MTIKLSDIIPAPWNTRGEITPESVKELAASIEEQGLIQPITIWLKGELPNNVEARYCIAGNRRLAALLSIYGGKADLKDSWYKFFDGTEHEAKMVTVTENLQREDVSPIEEAALVAECLDAGMTAEEIAAKTGRSASWVNRRRKLITLADEWKDAADRFTTEQLEKLASYPVEAQKRVAKAYRPDTANWDMIRYPLERESRDLDGAKFDTKPCRECLKRTGVEADLFGIADGDLGKCLDCKCFDAKEKERVEAEIKKSVGDAECVRLKYEYMMPRDDDSSAKKSKKHPCAYVCHGYDGEIKVRWGESAKAKKEREETEWVIRENARKAEQEARAEIEAVTDKLDEVFNVNDDNCPEGLVGEVQKFVADFATDEQSEFVINAVCTKICEWHDSDEWAEIVAAFDFVAKLAGLTDAEVKTLLDSVDNK